MTTLEVASKSQIPGVSCRRRSGRLAGTLTVAIAGIGLLAGASGCNLLAFAGVAAHAVPPPAVQPKYAGLKGQHLAIMVWADRGVATDWPNLQLDTANQLQDKLVAARDNDKPDQLKGAALPYQAASVVRFQYEHPDLDGAPATEIATRLPNITRLVYVEVDSFQTRSDSAVGLFRGGMDGTIQVVEVDPKTGHAQSAYREDGIHVDYPKKAAPEGVTDLGDAKTYAGTLDLFTTELLHRLAPYEAEDD